jgi:hypothetical protein
VIVKIQKPLAWTPEEGPTVLIYNRDRSLEVQVPFTKTWAVWFGPKLKRYARAYITKNKQLVIGRVVSDRDW